MHGDLKMYLIKTKSQTNHNNSDDQQVKKQYRHFFSLVLDSTHLITTSSSKLYRCPRYIGISNEYHKYLVNLSWIGQLAQIYFYTWQLDLSSLSSSSIIWLSYIYLKHTRPSLKSGYLLS